MFPAQSQPSRRPRGTWTKSGCLIVYLFLCCTARGASLPVITNVSVVNLTASSFSVVWVGSASATNSISVFADPGGLTNLTGQLLIESYPLHTGAPAATNAYDRRLSQAYLRQKTISQGLVHLRVADCTPNTTYYFRLQSTSTSGQTVSWPAAGPLPSARTAQETSFVLQSRQLLFDLPGLDPSGSIVILANSNTPSLLAAVAGDGVPNNQVFFSINDLLAASGHTNFMPLGNQEFTAVVFNGSTNRNSQTYSLAFTTDFLVGQPNQISLGSYAVVTLGSAILRAGDTSSLPIDLYASAVKHLTFTLLLPTNRFSSLTLQPGSSQLGVTDLHPIGPNLIQVTLDAAPGQTLQGNQQIARLNFSLVSNQPSAFVPFSPQSLQGLNADGSAVVNFAVHPGRIVVVGNEPLLEAFRGPGGVRQLALYGKPWASYELQFTHQLAGSNAWSRLARVPMTNIVELFSGLDTNSAVSLYRAVEFAADPPILEAALAGTNRAVLVYGRTGTNYVLQYTTNLSGVVTWYPALNYSLTNSFQLLSGFATTNPAIFYRIRRP